jgi:hypothetical protein
MLNLFWLAKRFPNFLFARWKPSDLLLIGINEARGQGLKNLNENSAKDRLKPTPHIVCCKTMALTTKTSTRQHLKLLKSGMESRSRHGIICCIYISG